MKRRARFWAWLRQGSPRLVAVSWLVIAGAVQIWQPFGESSTDVALTMVLVASGAWLLIDRRALDRIGGLSAFGFEVQLQVPDYSPGVDREADQAPESKQAAGSEAESWQASQFKLEAKLAYLAKHTLPDHLPDVSAVSVSEGDDRPFTNVGSLLNEGLLNEAEAGMGSLMQRMSTRELLSVPRAKRAELVRDAADLARTVRAKVFRRLVLNYLSERSLGEATELGDQIRLTGGGSWTVIWPTWGSPRGSLVRKRADILAGKNGGVIVVPKFPGKPPLFDDSNPRVSVTTLDGLSAALPR